MLKASSRRGFGIHSPLVFRFQQEVLNPRTQHGEIYSRYVEERDKVLRMILRIIDSFHLKSPLLLNNDYRESFESYCIEYSTLPVKSEGYDLVVLHSDEFFDENYLKENAFVVLVGSKGLEKNPLRYRSKVFLDLYSAGVCIFRKGLSHQEFKLKL